MKVVLVSGFLNNHLLPLCDELDSRSEFNFVATQKWDDNSYNRGAIEKGYVIKYYIDSNKEIVEDIILNADVVIFGGSSLSLLQLRKETGKLCFIYTERLFKKGTWRRFIPSVKRVNDIKFKSPNNNLFVLCAGSTVKSDLKKIKFDTDRCFKFGYFPLVLKRSKEEILSEKDSSKLHIVYVGRLLKLKRVQDALKCCRLLKKDEIQFDFTIIGDGPELVKLKKLKKRYNLSEVNFVGEKLHDEAICYMRKSDILFFTSNGYEGWGAVVNEALASGCAVIGSSHAGASEFLIKNKFNGQIYTTGNIKDFHNKVIELINDCDLKMVQQNAYKTIYELWNAKTAAERFMEVSTNLLRGQTIEYDSGPMSKA